MRTKRVLGLLSGAAMVLQLCAQIDWNMGGNLVTLPADYLGCNAASNQPLRFTTFANFPHQWRTNNVLHMRLTETLLGQTIGSYGGLDLSGHLGIGNFTSANVPTPFSLLHLDNGGTQFSAYRPWQRSGLTITQGSDLGYLGLKNETGDVNSLALCWADNTVGDGPDRLKFIFLSQPVGASGVAGTLDGLEAARFTPANTGNQSFFGVGDWFTANLDPRERLDILDGRARIRVLPDPPGEATGAYRVMVVDDTPLPSNERGVVKWVDPADLGGADCDWEVIAGDVVTAYQPATTNGDCPEEDNKVGIGTNAPAAKLHVTTNDFANVLKVEASMVTGTNVAGSLSATGATTTNQSLLLSAGGSGTISEGIRLAASNATGTNTGVIGTVSGNATTNTGSRFTVSGGSAANYGADLSVTGASAINTGLRSTVSGATTSNFGVKADVLGSANGGNAGVAAHVSPLNNVDMDYAEGVSGTVEDPSKGASGVRGTVNLNQTGDANAQMHGVYGSLRANAGDYLYLYGTRGVVSTAAATIGTAYGAYGSVSGASQMSASYGLWGQSHVSGAVGSNYGGRTTALWDQGATIVQSIGLRAVSQPVVNVTTTVPASYGVIAAGRAGDRTYGVYSTGYSGGSDNFGVFGNAAGAQKGNFSIYGANPGSGGNDWAGFFDGATYCAGTTFFPSDEQLKTDIVPVGDMEEDPVVRLMQLQPRAYEYNIAEYPHMGLPGGEQYGFLAQELEEVFPQMVRNVVQPAELDSTGGEVHPAVEFKAVTLQGLLPLVIEALKRQDARVASLEEQIAACCNAIGADHRDALLDQLGGGIPRETDLRIIPNPVADQTELRYTVGTEGRVRLEITDASGRTIQTQDEGMRSTGTFSYGWNTTMLAPGTYHCTLYVNDEPLVKKAVKLNVR